MKASYRWLRELLPTLQATPSEVATRFTHAGLEVEGTVEYGAGAESCLVARVVSIRPHPTKSGLRLVTVERGGGTQEVVCGAPNVPDPGGLVVLAPLGAHLPAAGLTIAPRAIAGVTSEGMLCSEQELGLSEESNGIIILPAGTAEPGTRLSDAVPNMRDTIFEIGLTPNRPDGLGHVGLARELAALMNLPFAGPSTGIEQVSKRADVSAAELALVTVDDDERCPHYGAAGVVDVTVAPSPLWLRYRLQALGIRSISNVVDITNLVMLEYGHPMHAFDLDRVRPDAAGKKHIFVRRAKDGETMVTLDNVERRLVGDDLLICDGAGPVALAGVMGGASSDIKPETRRVFFEVATFDARGVRRTARRHGMHTESSHRFERGIDPGDTARVLDRAVALTSSLAEGAAARGRVHVQGKRVSSEPLPTTKRVVRFRLASVRGLTGVDVPEAECTGILERLGCELRGNGGEREVHVPTHRPDIMREADLVEEVIRVYGMDLVPVELPAIRASRDVGGKEELARRTKEICAALGLSEAITFSFTSPRALELLRAPAPAVRLDNPMAEHQSVLRTTLLVGLLDALRNARRHGERDVRVFTVGPVFLPSAPAERLPEEKLRAAFVLAGDRPAWLERGKPLNVWDAKGYALEIAHRVSGKPVTIEPAHGEDAPKHLHPRGAAYVLAGGNRVGSFGPLHPDVVDALELDGEALVFELELDSFAAGAALPHYVAIPKFPASARDVALIVKDGIAAGEVEAAVRAAAGPLAEDVRIFDRFVGGQVPAGHSSLAFRVVYRSAEKTLTDAEVDAAHANVVKVATERFGATLRA